MTADLYRDARLGIVARIAELVGRIREREGEVTEAFWSSLEPAARERLEELREAVELVGADKELSFDELARSETLLAAYVDEVERLIARLPILEEEWHELPEEVPDPPAPRNRLLAFGRPSASERADLERAFERTVRERDRDAAITFGPRGALARFRDTVKRAPFTLRATAQANGAGRIEEVDMVLVTSVSRATPRLVVRHETMALAVGKALGVRSEVEIGDPSFDGLFLIEGSREAALRLLSPNVRGMLLVLAHFDVPTLEVDPPKRVASLRWRFEPTTKALDAAVRVLAGIREVDATVQFRR